MPILPAILDFLCSSLSAQLVLPESAPKDNQCSLFFSAFSVCNESVVDLLSGSGGGIGTWISQNPLELRRTAQEDALDTDGYSERAFCQPGELGDEMKLLRDSQAQNLVVRLRLSLFDGEGELCRQSILTLAELWVPSVLSFPISQVDSGTQYLYALSSCVRGAVQRAKGLLDVRIPYRLSVVTRILQVPLPPSILW